MSDRQSEGRWGSRVLIGCALIVTFLVARREFSTSGGPTGPRSIPDRTIENWRDLAAEGHRIGAPQAKVTILEFADFECPACKAFTLGALRDVLRAFPTDVALVFRHWPLSYHRFAIPAARAAECASEQGRFEPMQYLLFEKQDSLGLKPFTEMASEAGVSDLALFDACIKRPGPFSAIDKGMAAAEAIGAHGTPAILVEGTLLGNIPTTKQLESLVRRHLARESR